MVPASPCGIFLRHVLHAGLRADQPLPSMLLNPSCIVVRTTPGTLYYQCHTHQKLGWKIMVSDAAAAGNVTGEYLRRTGRARLTLQYTLAKGHVRRRGADRLLGYDGRWLWDCGDGTSASIGKRARELSMLA